MTNHSSATTRGETPHATGTTRTNAIMQVLRQRAQAVLNDPSLDPKSRAIIWNNLQKNEPWLARLVRRTETRENAIESEAPEVVDPNRSTIETLAEIICSAGDETAAALFVLMGRLQNSAEPRTLANTAKHFAFTRCGELNLYEMVDDQIAIVERELLAGRS